MSHSFRVAVWVFAIASVAFGLGGSYEEWRLTATVRPLSVWSQIGVAVASIAALALEMRQDFLTRENHGRSYPQQN